MRILQPVIVVAVLAVVTVGCRTHTYTQESTTTRVISNDTIVAPDDPSTDATRNTKTKVVKETIVIE